MDLITLDFESYYSPTFGFKNMTTEEYVRDPRFEVIGVSVKVNDGPAEWASGSRVQTAAFLAEFDWANSMVLAHNTKFDGAILSWLFGIKAKVWADTLSMARAVHGTEVGASLKALAEMYGIGEKGTEVVNALGKHREDFTPAELGAYGDYCINDTELCYKLFLLMGKGFPRQEMRVIDTTLRMFLEPVFELDLPRLEQHLIDIRARKEALLDTVSVTKKDLMSNPKFAAALEAIGVTPPMKISLTTGKPTFAFAKSDEGFKALLEHEDLDVQLLAEARLGNKSSLEETRTERFIGIAKRGKLPIPIRYYAAHTGRWGGDDKINLQNLPSRGVNGKALKSCIIAPEGYTIIDPDSSQIEARVLAWLAGQDNIVTAFSNKQDVYSLMAADIYSKLLSDVSGPERFIGKQTVLGCISEGTPVLCESGWKPIEDVSTTDRVWDGAEWVCHQGLLKKGVKETVNLCGSWLTPDHKILCGTQWKETASVVQDANILSQALGTGAVNLPSQVMSVEYEEGLKQLLLRAHVAVGNTLLNNATSRRSKAPDATCVQRSPQTMLRRCTGAMQLSFQTMRTGLGYLAASVQQSPGAIPQPMLTSSTMGVGESASVKTGGIIKGHSLSTFKLFQVGTTQFLNWTGWTTKKATNRGTSSSVHEKKTWQTDEVSAGYSKKLMTYDLAYAGPRNRFTIGTNSGPVIAHNCGYGMGADKFRAQLASMGVVLDIMECRRIINAYRMANDRIVALWKESQRALISMVNGTPATLGRTGVLEVVPKQHAIKLPSGLLMRYTAIEYAEGDRGPTFSYKARYARTNIYGGKVVENVCQAIARCIIAEQMLRIQKYVPVRMTVHDSLPLIVRDADVDTACKTITECMRWTPDWAAGLPLDCELKIGKNYGELSLWKAEDNA